MQKPYVVCHMASTVNGKILTNSWGDPEKKKLFSRLYETCHLSYNSQAWMCGRVTMEKDFSEGAKPVLVKPPQPLNRQPFTGNPAARSFAVAVDAKGKLGWPSNELGGDHIIVVLTEAVPDEYVYYLQQKNISYIFAGKEELDFRLALHQLAELFSIQTLMLEGGGLINGSLLGEGLIDEISLLLLPIADSSPGSSTSFEAGGGPSPAATPLQLAAVQQLEHGVLWLKYRGRDQ
jgi:riboflavin biosynthesis pyrimidine reductase